MHHFLFSNTRLVLTLVLGALAAAKSSANGLDAEDVRAAVRTWVRGVTADAKPDAEIESLEPYVVDGRIVAYIAHLKMGGFCLCGADDRTLPVYLYVTGGAFDNTNPNYRVVLDEIRNRIENLDAAARRTDTQSDELRQLLTDRAALWRGLVAGEVPVAGDSSEQRCGQRSEPSRMELHVTSRWNQGAPYNLACPMLPPSQATVTGCVATAAAQIMYYWKWPVTGEGSRTQNWYYNSLPDWISWPLPNNPNIPSDWAGLLEWSNGQLRARGNWDSSLRDAANQIDGSSEYQTALAYILNSGTTVTVPCAADFGATTYGWNFMRDIVNDPPADLPESFAAAEISTLSYHAGIACQMNWGILGSAAGWFSELAALRDHFRYDADISGSYRDIDVMTEEIQWLRPLTFGAVGMAPGAAHDWVVLGFDKATDPNRQFLMNFGWGGDWNSWYSCDNVNVPNGGPYNGSQVHVTKIAPRDVVRFVGNTWLGDGSPDAPYWNVNQALLSAPDGVTLIFKAGSTNDNLGMTITLDRPMTLRGLEVTIQP